MTRLRLLVADDSAAFLEALHDWLADDPRVEIVGTASSGEEAIALAPALAPDVVLMDLHMPGIGGLEATRRLKRGDRAPCVIVVTLAPSESLQRAALEAGADFFLAKERLAEELPALLVRLASGDRQSGPPLASPPSRRRRRPSVHAPAHAYRAHLHSYPASELFAAETRLRAVLDAQPECVKLVAPDGTLLDINRAGLAMIEAASIEEVRGVPIVNLVSLEHRAAYRALHERVCAGEPGSLQFEIIGLRGTRRWLETQAVPFRARPEEPICQLAVTRDITVRRREERLLALEHGITKRLAEAETASAGIAAVIRAICEAEGWEAGRYFHADEAAGVLRLHSGWSKNDPAFVPLNAASHELTYAHGVGIAGRVWASGEPIWVADVGSDLRVFNKTLADSGVASAFVFPVTADGRVLGVIATFSREKRAPDERLLAAVRTIGAQLGQFIERKQAEERLAFLAQFDPLTGLPNRALFRDRLEQALAQAKRNRRQVGLMLLDLDNFKNINDTLGHGAGDRLLEQAAQRLKQCLRDADTVARLGGDEFAVVLPDLDTADDAAVVAQKMLEVLRAPFLLTGQEAFLSASIGIAVYPTDAEKIGALLRNADTAMYRAKASGRDTFQFFMPRMNAEIARRLALERDLRHALARGEFELHYQPKCQMSGGHVIGAEALLRWRRPDGENVSPAEFIPVLEDTGLIVEVGEWALREACRQHVAWREAGLGDIGVAVNVSARQFRAGRLQEAVERALTETGCAAQCLELEITESTVMHDVSVTVQALEALRALGVRIAVDDFGTGYSSLAYLKRLPIDVVKIDRAFVDELPGNASDAAIVTAILAMAKKLGLRAIAEGVETEDQRRFLEAEGCDEMQGYLISRPLPAIEFARWVRGRTVQSCCAVPPST